MDLLPDRIAALKKDFPNHPSVKFLGVTLDRLEIGGDLSLAVITAVAKHEFTVHSDLKCDLIVQGGISHAIANFAGVYAAMVHTEKHTPLSEVNRIKYTAPIKEGEKMVATAMARRINELIIEVNFYISVNGHQVLSGNSYYRDDKKK